MCGSDGQCPCKAAATGRRCDECLQGYYALGSNLELGCTPCACNTAGTINGSNICEGNGSCPCLPSNAGERCDEVAQVEAHPL